LTPVLLLLGISFGLPTSNLTARLAFVDFDGKGALADLNSQGWLHALTLKYSEKMLKEY
jgi:hypothetical protein